jgi:hypothetical protein
MTDDAQSPAGLFGDLTEELAARLVAALRDAHQVGVRTQAASEQDRRYGYGSTWPVRFERVVLALRDLPGAEVVRVPRTHYSLVRVAGRLVVPSVVAHAVADVPTHPRVTEPLRDLLARGAPRSLSPPTLFELGEPVPLRPDPSPGELAAVLVGVVCRAEAPDLDALYWGPVTAIDDDGTVTWSRAPLPLDTAPSAPAPRTAQDAEPGDRTSR